MYEIKFDQIQSKVLYIGTSDTIMLIMSSHDGKPDNQNISGIKSFTELDYLADLKEVNIFGDESSNVILLTALNGGETSMAKLLHLCCQNKFHFSSSKTWWYWDSKCWIRDPTGIQINNVLYNEVGNVIRLARTVYKNLSLVRGIVANIPKIYNIDIIKKKLESRDYKRRIIQEAEWIFPTNSSIKDIEKLLDTNPYLIGFPNGVFDLNSMTFRLSKPDDYISIILDYEYSDKVDESIIELQAFIDNIMPDSNDRHYLLKLLSSGLLGQNPNELFHIFTGVGRNGKSKLSELLKLTLGGYFASISSTFLTAKITSANNATPHLMNLKGKRLVIGSEPDHHTKLNATAIKSLSGNDEVVGRKLYQDVQTFRPIFKMIVLCNNIPDVDASDAALWARCRCLTFPTQFVDKPTASHERLKNEYLSIKLPTWRLAFFQLLIRYFAIFMREGLAMTPNMLGKTQEYQVESDIYLQWLNERTEPSESATHTLVLYDDFCVWHRSNLPNKPIPSQIIFARGIKVYKTIKKNVWDGYKNKQGVEGIKIKSRTEINIRDHNVGNANNLAVYALELMSNKYYVGKTNDIDRRFTEHSNGLGAIWTKIYPPVTGPIILKENASAFDENVFFKEYVMKYGIENVRGDVYCQVNLSNEDIRMIQKEIDGAADQCYVCHQKGHFTKQCAYQSN